MPPAFALRFTALAPRDALRGFRPSHRVRALDDPESSTASTTPFASSFDVADGDFSRPAPKPGDGSGPENAALAALDDPLADETRCLETSNRGTVLGAVALITGSTVGAGILALPETVAPAGIGPSSVVLCACWALLACEALLLAEVNVAVMRERDEYRLVHGRGHSPVTISLSEMAGRTLGDVGAGAVSATYIFLSTTLLVAYIAKSGTIVHAASGGAIAPGVAALAFATGMGGALTVGGVRLADKMNKALTLALLALFGVLVAGGAARADFASADWVGDWSRAPQTVPVVFLALVYHDLVPVVCSYLAGDVRKIRRAVILGSVAPLLMFLSWDAVALGCHASDAGDPLAALMASGDGAASLIVGGFSFCAIATSFIGTAIGLSEFAQPRLERWAEKQPWRDGGPGGSGRRGSGRARKLLTRAGTHALILAAPACVAATNPDVFLPATNFAGAYCMSTMFGILPPMMAFSMRAQLAEKGGARLAPLLRRADPRRVSRALGETFSPGVRGGTPALAALSFAACAITLGQLRNDLARTIERGSGAAGGAAGFGSTGSGGADAVAGGVVADAVDAFAAVVPDEAISATAALAGDAWEAATRLFQ